MPLGLGSIHVSKVGLRREPGGKGHLQVALQSQKCRDEYHQFGDLFENYPMLKERKRSLGLMIADESDQLMQMISTWCDYGEH